MVPVVFIISTTKLKADELDGRFRTIAE